MALMLPSEPIAGRKVLLDVIDLGDVAAYARWVNDPEVQSYLNRPWPISLQEEERRLRALVAAEDAVGFAVKHRESGRLIGRTAIWNIHRVNRSGLFTILIGEPEMRSRGFGREATALTTIYAMDTLRLNRLELEVFAYNERALRVYEGLGFRQEGTRREARLHQGVWHDALLMSILAREWRGGLRDRFLAYMDGAPAGAAPGSGPP
jgi:RimJ/RimL family protein N-acetyltransferase